MLNLKWSSLALLALQVASVFAQIDTDGTEPVNVEVGGELKVQFEATFPDSDFGVKLVNGRPTKALIEVTNHEDAPISVVFMTGALHTTQPLPEDAHPTAGILRNLTATTYDVSVAAGAKHQLPYTFVLDMQPQDVKLEFYALVTNDKNQVSQLLAHSGKASIVEAPISFLDPGVIFLYLFLLGAGAGTLYFVYNTWIATLFPKAQKPKVTKKQRRAEVVEPLSGNESTGVTSGTDKDYDENWIPEHHINRPAAKRVKSGASAKKVKE